jgi:hypothetical protein
MVAWSFGQTLPSRLPQLQLYRASKALPRSVRCLGTAPSARLGAQDEGAKLAQHLEHLKSQHSQLQADQLDEIVRDIEVLSSELGMNRVGAPVLHHFHYSQAYAVCWQQTTWACPMQVVPEWNDGSFWASPISGRLKTVTADDAPLTLGALTFDAVKPADLKV